MDTAILLCNYYPKIVINGSLIDAFEYYLSILEHNSDVVLLMVDFNRPFVNKLKSIVRERYYLDDLNWEDNIKIIKRSNIITRKFKKVLIVDYSTINRLKGLLFADEIIVISEFFTDNPDYFMSHNLYNIKYYGEMPFVYKDHDYRMKLLFDRFKPLTEVKKGYYIHSPKNKKPQVLKKELNLPDDVPVFFKQESHMNNFFEYFDKYIYYHCNSYFDPHPRLPLECMFYDKHIKYINNYDIKDGSYYRFNDLSINGITNRTLNKDDEIVRQFI